MPAYEFRCRQCGDTFIVSRPMDRSGDPADCPAGHADTVRLLTVAAAGGSAGGSAGSASGPAPSGGGCCGGSCGCG